MRDISKGFFAVLHFQEVCDKLMICEEKTIISTKLLKPSSSLRPLISFGVAEGSLYSVSSLGEVANELGPVKTAYKPHAWTEGQGACRSPKGSITDHW